MNEHTSPAFWPAREVSMKGGLCSERGCHFTVLAQEGGISRMNGRHPQSGGSFIIATAVSDEEEERATRLLKTSLPCAIAFMTAGLSGPSLQPSTADVLRWSTRRSALNCWRAGQVRRFPDRPLYRDGDPHLRSPAPDASAQPDPRRYQTRVDLRSSRRHLPSVQLRSFLRHLRRLLPVPACRVWRHARLHVTGTHHAYPARR